MTTCVPRVLVRPSGDTTSEGKGRKGRSRVQTGTERYLHGSKFDKEGGFTGKGKRRVTSRRVSTEVGWS